jgi:hypothetical protein
MEKQIKKHVNIITKAPNGSVQTEEFRFGFDSVRFRILKSQTEKFRFGSVRFRFTH